MKKSILNFFPISLIKENGDFLSIGFAIGLAALFAITAILLILWIVASVNFIIIDSSGIKVTYFNKVVISISWGDISNIEYEYQFRNTLFKVSLYNGKTHSFIKNKKFKFGVLTFGNERLKHIIENL